MFNSCKSPNRFHLTSFLRVCLTTLLIVFFVHFTPAIAQKRTAPVVLDGQQLFEVSASAEMTASDRAKQISSELAETVRSTDPVKVSVVERNQTPTLLVNDRYLMSVTERDVLPGNSANQQAQLWATRLQAALQEAQQSRTPAYLRQALLLTAAVLAIALALHWSLGWFWQRTIRPTVRALIPQPLEGDVQDSFRAINLLLSGGLAIIRSLLWLGTLLYITNLFSLTRYWSYYIANILISSFTSPILTLGQGQYSVLNLLLLGLLIVCLVILSKTCTDFLRSRVLQRTGVNRGAQEAIAVVFRYSLVFFGTLVLLQIWGLDISSLAIFASALSVGIGFGLQDIAKNFGSGLVLVFERPIQVGDFIEVGSFQGTVERIGARSTLIRTLDQVSIIVPNSRFLEEEVINWSHDNPISRIHVPVGVAYSSNIQIVRQVLMEATKGHPRVLSTPAPQVFFKGFGDSSLDFELLVWTAEPSQQIPLKSDLYFRIEELLRQHQIEVPFPQRDLYLRADRLPIALSPEMEQALQQWMARSSNGKESDV